MSRLACAQVVHAVCEKGESLDDALTTHSSNLLTADLAMVQDISYGAVRWYLAYMVYINQQLKKPFKPKDRILNAILVTALYQLDYTKHAPHAIVNEAVKSSKNIKRQWSTGIVNALLRGYMRLPKKPSSDSSGWISSSFPEWMATKFKRDWPQYAEQIIAASQAKPPMTLRVNAQQFSPEAYLTLLAENAISAASCDQSAVGITLDTPVSVHKLPLFDQAAVSVQDESAQLAVPILDLKPKQNVLDACAAPGGKTLHLLEVEPKLSQVVALDLAHRLARLKQNVRRANANVKVIEGSLLESEPWWNGEKFDRILLDVPCTGTGVIRRHPDIKLRRTHENAVQFARKQLSLLLSAWPLLKVSGQLLYTSCSIFPEENDQCIEKFVSEIKNAQSVGLPVTLGIQTTHGRQRLPGVHSGDGFYYALLKKT